MSLGGTAFTELCVKELELCGVHEGEVMAVLSQGDERLDYCDAFLAAATQLGATAFHVRLPTESPTLSGDVGSWTVGATPLAGNRPAVEAIKSADILIDTMFLLFSKEQLEIQEAGTRIAALHRADRAPDAALPHPRAARARRVRREAARQRQLLRFTNALGTDCTYKLGDYGVIDRVRLHRHPGPLGPLAVGLPLHRRRRRRRRRQGRARPRRHHLSRSRATCETPIELTIEQGRIVDIRGELDADLLRDYMRSVPRREGLRRSPTSAGG